MSHPEQVVHVGQQLIGEDTVPAFELLVVAVAQTGQRLHIRPCPGIGFERRWVLLKIPRCDIDGVGEGK